MLGISGRVYSAIMLTRGLHNGTGALDPTNSPALSDLSAVCLSAAPGSIAMVPQISADLALSVNLRQ